MLFSSVSFLYGFLPLALAAHWLAPRRWRNTVLLIASLINYMLGEPGYMALMLMTAASDWAHGLLIARWRETPRARRVLLSSIVIDLGLLAFFKYADFVIDSLNMLPGVELGRLGLPLPLGISFFTFQTLSYTVDVYRGRVAPQRSLASYVTYVSLFPQLIAGPIVRYGDVDAELRQRTIGIEDVGLGVRRLVLGLGKKALLANMLGELCAEFRAADAPGTLFYWMYAGAYALQVYFDFSGYSDMAIGMGRMLGFKFPENFDHPLTARSLSEFWRRWHMTLGSWFRDYVYIPLGGNRAGRLRWVRNLAIVWLLTGLWHGAAWNFVLWGAMMGALIIGEKLMWGKALERWPAVLQHVYVLIAVLLSFVVFGADGLGGALSDLGGLFGRGGRGFADSDALYWLSSYWSVLVVAALGATTLPARLWQWVSRHSGRVADVVEPLALACVLLLATAALVSGSFNPFLYFRF